MYLEKKYEGKLTKFVCRDTRYGGWAYPYSRVYIDARDVSKDVEKHCAWMQIFSESTFARPACYQCPFTCIKRNSDITIGDFWGIEQAAPEFNDRLGISHVLIHSSKGMALFKNVKDKIIIKQCSIDGIRQVRLRYPTKEPLDRNKFWGKYEQSIDVLIDAYGRRGAVYRMTHRHIIPFIKKINLYNILYDLYQKIFRR